MSINARPQPGSTISHSISPVSPISSFLSIQAEQIAAEAALQKMMKKSLSQIQAEEEAIASLERFYRMTSLFASGERFIITRGH